MATKLINQKFAEVSDTTSEVIDFLRRDAADAQELAELADLEELEALETEEAEEEGEWEEEEHTDSGDWQTIAEQAIARNAVLEAALHSDSEEEEDDLSDEELEELLEAAVTERVDALFDAYDSVRQYLPGDYSLRGKSPLDVRVDALKHCEPRLDSEDSPVNFESEDAVNAALEAVKLVHQPRTDSGESQLSRVFSRQLGTQPRQDMDDMFGMKKKAKRGKRKADYSVQ